MYFIGSSPSFLLSFHPTYISTFFPSVPSFLQFFRFLFFFLPFFLPLFLDATKHLYNWLCRSVVQSVGHLVGQSVGGVTHSFNDPHVAPYWPTWPCFLSLFLSSVLPFLLSFFTSLLFFPAFHATKENDIVF